MASTDWLLLRIPARTDAELSWVLAGSDGQLLSAPDTDVSGIVAAAQGKRVALLVPGADVGQFQVALPAGNDAKLLQLVPFALEDQLSQDIDQLHFAVGTRDAAGLVPAAVVDRDLMQSWLDRAAALQLSPQAVFAESDLAPVLPGHVTLLLTDDQLLMRHDAGRPQLLPADDPVLALEMLLGTTDFSAVHLAVYSTPGDWALHGPAIEALRGRLSSLNVQLNNGGALAQYATSLSQVSPVNLLQGSFKPQRNTGAGWQQWRWAAMLAGVLLLLHGASSWWQLHQLRGAAAARTAEIERLYKAIYPGQSPGAEPRRTMEKRLAALAGGGGQHGELLSLLAAVAAAKQNVPLAQLQSISFEAGALKMKLGAPDAAALEEFNKALRASGYGATLVSSAVRDGKYEGMVELKSSRS